MVAFAGRCPQSTLGDTSVTCTLGETGGRAADDLGLGLGTTALACQNQRARCRRQYPWGRLLRLSWVSNAAAGGDGANRGGSRILPSELSRRCHKFVQGHGLREPRELLADLPASCAADRYGEGGVVGQLEEDVSRLLGKPAAVFMPSGTMAQQIALRVHADRSGRRGVACHQACHLLHHEEFGFRHLHGLREVKIGDANRLLRLDDLVALGPTEEVGALLLELPQRDLGGQLPAYGDLLEQVALARTMGWAVHLDGARIWEASAGYERSPAELAGLFDTTYVSFYKGLGAIAGCCLAGPEDVIAEAKLWRTRHGGRLVALWPYAASARSALRVRLPRMTAYRDRALAIAAALRLTPAVVVLPQPPQTSMMHLLLPVDLTIFEERVAWLATERGIWTWGGPFPSALGSAAQGVRVELTVGDATMAMDVEEVVGAIGYLATGDSSSF